MTTASTPVVLPTRTLFITLGVMGVILGVIVLAWPEATVVVLAWLLGINLVLTGIVSTIAGVSEDLTGGQRVLTVLFGVFALLAGVIVFARPVQTAVVVAIVLGAFWVVGGIAEILAAITGSAASRGFAVLSGLVSLAAGIVVLAWPDVTVLALVWIVGLWMILFGILRIVVGIRSPRVAVA